MKKNISEKDRVKNLIESNKNIISEDCKNIVSMDIKRVLEEYFVLDGKVNVKITLINEKYVVEIETLAKEIRPFGTIN